MTHFLALCLVLWTALNSPSLAASEQGSLSPEQVLRQELLLNTLISDIYLLQLDFQDQRARERLLETAHQLTRQLSLFPEQTQTSESNELLTASKRLWPVINQHIDWLANLPNSEEPPNFKALTNALVNYDRKLQVLRQALLTANPRATQSLRFLEQALLMQKMTREYLSLVTLDENIASLTGQQLQSMANQFNTQMDAISQELSHHTHARQSVRQAHTAWQFIARSIRQFPKKPVPSMVALYSENIVAQLSSIHNMF